METEIFFGASLLAAVVAGMVALFAPCCISVMLPAYFASSFQNRRLLVAMTFVFAAGIATIILPLAMGASFLRRLFIEEHLWLYLGGGGLMLALAVFVLLGGKLMLPMPSQRGSRRAGPVGVYSLGLFSGVASSCCAPVLAGVIALSGLASSFTVALAFGLAYVVGMVAPLFVIALLWDRFNWKESRLFRPRPLTWRVGPVTRTISATNGATAALLVVMAGLAIWSGLSQDAMPAAGGWQAEASVRLQHYGRLVTAAVDWIPNPVAGLILIGIVALLARVAVRQMREERRRAPVMRPRAGGAADGRCGRTTASSDLAGRHMSIARPANDDQNRSTE